MLWLIRWFLFPGATLTVEIAHSNNQLLRQKSLQEKVASYLHTMGNFIYLAIYSRQHLFNSSSSSSFSWSYILLTMESPVLEKVSTFQRPLCLLVPLKRSLWRPTV